AARPPGRRSLSPPQAGLRNDTTCARRLLPTRPAGPPGAPPPRFRGPAPGPSAGRRPHASEGAAVPPCRVVPGRGSPRTAPPAVGAVRLLAAALLLGTVLLVLALVDQSVASLRPGAAVAARNGA